MNNTRSNDKPSVPSCGPAEIAEFREDMEENMNYLQRNFVSLSHAGDRSFVESLCDSYERYGRLSDKQIVYTIKFWRLLKNLRRGSGSDEY